MSLNKTAMTWTWRFDAKSIFGECFLEFSNERVGENEAILFLILLLQGRAGYVPR
jgi:hypothetical protein